MKEGQIEGFETYIPKSGGRNNVIPIPSNLFKRICLLRQNEVIKR